MTKVWLIVDVPAMDCSDRMILGPYKSEAAAEKVLLNPSMELAYGDTFDSANAQMIVGEVKKVKIKFDPRGKRYLVK